MKHLLRATLLLTAVATLSACNQKPKADTSKKADKTEEKAGHALRIAYVDLDTVQAHYDLFTDLSKQLEQKTISAQKEIQGKQRVFQEHYNALQTKYNNGQFASQTEFENAQAALQREQEAGAKREQELMGELQQHQAEGIQQVSDSVENFIKSYNKDKKYDFILMKATTLYANPACDITPEVIKGLNARYKKSRK